MSMRGVATGWAGSAAVLAIAAASLGAVRAEADSAPAKAIAAPRPAARVEPASTRAARLPTVQPAWLRRLLSPTDLERGSKRS